MLLSREDEDRFKIFYVINVSTLYWSLTCRKGDAVGGGCFHHSTRLKKTELKKDKEDCDEK